MFRRHPLSQDPLGSEASIKSVTSDKIFDYHKKFFIPGRAAIVATGGLTHKKISELAKKYFGAWSKLDGVIDNLQEPSVKKGFIFEKASSKQTHIIFKYISPKYSIEESIALEILINYLSYGDSSLLKQEIRTGRGLAYNISAGIELYQDASMFFVQAATTKPDKIVEIILDIMRKF